MPKGRIEIWIGGPKEEIDGLVSTDSGPVIAETLELTNDVLRLIIRNSVSVAVGPFDGGADLLRRHPQIANVKLLNQSSHRWYDGALVDVKIDSGTPFEQAVRKAADVIAGAFTTIIEIDK